MFSIIPSTKTHTTTKNEIQLIVEVEAHNFAQNQTATVVLESGRCCYHAKEETLASIKVVGALKP